MHCNECKLQLFCLYLQLHPLCRLEQDWQMQHPLNVLLVQMYNGHHMHCRDESLSMWNMMLGACELKILQLHRRRDQGQIQYLCDIFIRNPSTFNLRALGA